MASFKNNNNNTMKLNIDQLRKAQQQWTRVLKISRQFTEHLTDGEEVFFKALKKMISDFFRFSLGKETTEKFVCLSAHTLYLLVRLTSLMSYLETKYQDVFLSSREDTGALRHSTFYAILDHSNPFNNCFRKIIESVDIENEGGETLFIDLLTRYDDIAENASSFSATVKRANVRPELRILLDNYCSAIASFLSGNSMGALVIPPLLSSVNSLVDLTKDLNTFIDHIYKLGSLVSPLAPHARTHGL